MPAARRPRRQPEVRPRGGAKPLDVGSGVVCASLAADGRWLSLGTAHRGHGFVELSAVPDIDPAWRSRPDLVRRYRAMLADEPYAFLGWVSEPAEVARRTSQRWLAGGVQIECRYVGWTHRCTTRPKVGGRSIVQHHVLRSSGANHPPVIVLTARGRLDRPALAEITEVEPPQPTGARTVRSTDGGRLRLVAAELPVAATIDVRTDSGAGWALESDSNVAQLMLSWPAGEAELGFEISCAIGRDVA